MKKEKFNYPKKYFNFSNEYNCKEYVYNHRNILGKSRRYIDVTFPVVVIREVSTSPEGNEKTYWYWAFFDNYYIIYQFNYKPSNKEYNDMRKDISKEYNKEA